VRGLLEGLDGFVPLALLLIDLAQVVVGDLVGGIDPDRLLQPLLGGVVEAVLELVDTIVGELDGLDRCWLQTN
jgi:hypothetical protein